MQQLSQPEAVGGQLPEAVADATQLEATPAAEAAIDRAAIEAELRTQIEADIEAKRIKPLERKLSERETERHKVAQELAELKALNASYEARVKEDGADDDWVELQRHRSREAAQKAAPDETLQREIFETDALAKAHGVAIQNADGTYNPDLPWAAVNAALSPVEGIRILKAAIIDTATSKRAAGALAKAKEEADARIAELEAKHQEELRSYQRVNVGGQGGGSNQNANRLRDAYVDGRISSKEYAAGMRQLGREP